MTAPASGTDPRQPLSTAVGGWRSSAAAGRPSRHSTARLETVTAETGGCGGRPVGEGCMTHRPPPTAAAPPRRLHPPRSARAANTAAVSGAALLKIAEVQTAAGRTPMEVPTAVCVCAPVGWRGVPPCPMVVKNCIRFLVLGEERCSGCGGVRSGLRRELAGPQSVAAAHRRRPPGARGVPRRSPVLVSAGPRRLPPPPPSVSGARCQIRHPTLRQTSSQFDRWAAWRARRSRVCVGNLL